MLSNGLLWSRYRVSDLVLFLCGEYLQGGGEEDEAEEGSSEDSQSQYSDESVYSDESFYMDEETRLEEERKVCPDPHRNAALRGFLGRACSPCFLRCATSMLCATVAVLPVRYMDGS